MRKYTEVELSNIVKVIINDLFQSPEKILNTYGTNINRKVKSFSHKELTKTEIEKSSLKVARATFDNLYLISNEMIIAKLSNEILDKNRQTGIELAEYKDYLFKFSKELVKSLIQHRYDQAKKERAKQLKKRNK